MECTAREARQRHLQLNQALLQLHAFAVLSRGVRLQKITGLRIVG